MSTISLDNYQADKQTKTITTKMECKKCKKPIRLGKVEFQGSNYHNGCFSCEACKKSLRGKLMEKINVIEGNFYDEECYEQVKDNICDKCGLLMTENCLEHNGKAYHEECFVCSKCNGTLSGKKFFLEDGMFFDAECYNSLNALTCDQCREMIEGVDIHYVTYHGKFIHHSCFICSACNKKLSTAEKFRDVKTTVKGALICIKCSECKPQVRKHSYPKSTFVKI